MKSFSKVFKEYKNLNSVTEKTIMNLEGSIKAKSIKIEEEIDYKVGQWKAEMERGFRIVEDLYTIFQDFTIGYLYPHHYGKPLFEQNRIDLIWHELKQTIEVKLAAISADIGKPLDEIPWHRILRWGMVCNICKIYRDEKTGLRYLPSRFGYEQDPEMLL